MVVHESKKFSSAYSLVVKSLSLCILPQRYKTFLKNQKIII